MPYLNFLNEKNVFLPPQSAETPRSSSWPRTSGFHPEDQGFESPTRYNTLNERFTSKALKKCVKIMPNLTPLKKKLKEKKKCD